MEICRQTIHKNLKKKNVIFLHKFQYLGLFRIHSSQYKRFGLACIRGVMFGLARRIRVGTVSLGTSQRPWCQPATFLAPDPAIIPHTFTYYING